MYFENLELLNTLNIFSITVRILLALLLGGLLGLEREQKQRPAGFRTYIIVCLGAALASITNLYIFETGGSGDPARIPAQVISGIGFLGAGTILVTRSNHIKGLTTAAGLWCAATIGIAAGSGFYAGAVICSLVIVFSLRFLSFVDRHFYKYNKYINLYAEFDDAGFLRSLVHYCRENSYELHELEITPAKNGTPGIATFSIKVPHAPLRHDVLEALNCFDGVVLIQELI